MSFIYFFYFRALLSYIKILWITKKFARKNLSIPDIFHEVVNRHPDKPCFLFQEEVWTFKEVGSFIIFFSHTKTERD